MGGSTREVGTTAPIRGVVLVCLVLVVPLAYSFRLTSFLYAKELVLHAGLCILTVAAALEGRPFSGGARAFAPLWVGLALAGAVHLLIRPAQLPSAAAIEMVRDTALLLVPVATWDLLGDLAWRRRLHGALVASGGVVAVLGILQYAGFLRFLFPIFPGYDQRVYSVFGNQDLFGGYLAMILALALATSAGAGRAQAGVLGIASILFAGLLLSGSRSAWAAAAAGGVVALISVRPSRRRLVIFGSAILLVGAVTVLLAPESTLGRARSAFSGDDVGLRARAWIVKGTVSMVRDHPVLGVSPGNYGYWSPRYLGDALHAPGGDRLYRDERRVDHPHSEFLDILAETGVVGLIFAGAMLLRLLCHRGPEWAGLAALLVFALANAPFHSVAHGLAGVLLAGMLLARKPDSVEAAPTRGYVRALTPVALAGAAALFHVAAVVLPSYHLRAALDAHLAGRDPIPLYARALAHPWPEPTARTKCAIALAEAGRLDAARRQLLRAKETDDSGEVYLMLGSVAAAQGDRAAARRWLEECLRRWPSNETARRLLDAVGG